MSLLALSGTSPLSREGRRSSNGMFQYRRGTTTPLTTPHPSWGKTSLAFLLLVHSSSTHGCGLSLQTDGHLFFSPFCIEAQESLPAHSPLHPPLILVGEVTPTATHPVPTRPSPQATCASSGLLSSHPGRGRMFVYEQPSYTSFPESTTHPPLTAPDDIFWHLGTGLIKVLTHRAVMG